RVLLRIRGRSFANGRWDVSFQGGRCAEDSLLGRCSRSRRPRSAGRGASSKPSGGSQQMSVDDALKAMRADMQSTRADLMAKNLTLTAEQAAKFWPVYNSYQKEQSVIMDEQLKNIQKYADSYATLDDASAKAYVTATLDRDAKMTA